VFIVFQTAYDEHSLQAFEVGAIGYLTKPYFLEDVIRVLNRIKKFRGEKPRIQVLNRAENLIPLPLSEICYFEAKLKHSLCVTRRGSFICPKSIGYLEEALKAHGFLRVHKSYLVNLDKVASFRSLPNGKIEGCFKDLPHKIITSKLVAKKLREILRI
jgi:two-component system LytT family response regulator